MTINLKADVAANGLVTFYVPSSLQGQQVDVQVVANSVSSAELSDEELIAERQRQIAALTKAFGAFADIDFNIPDDLPYGGKSTIT